MSNRQIITVNIGGCGVNLGQTLLEQLCVEHGISSKGYIESKRKYQSSIPISFNETSKGQYYARTIFYDLDPYSINMTKTIYPYSNLLCDVSYISGKYDCRTNFAAGHCTDGKYYIDRFSDKLRLMVEGCDNIQGFMINHSVSGGTGAGTGCLALERIAVDYRKKCKWGNCVFPDDRKLRSVLQVYNTLLCFRWLLDHNEVSVILDNWKVDELCKKQLNIKTPRYKNYNSLCTKLISTITSKFRFGLNEDMNIFARDMVPFPRLHFMIASLAPMLPKSKRKTYVNYKNDIQSLTDQCLNYDYFFQRFSTSGFDYEEDKYTGLTFFYQGDNIKESLFDVNESMHSMKVNKKFTFVEWNAMNNPSVKYIDAPVVSLPSDDIITGDKRVAMCGNNTAISRLLAERTCKKYDELYTFRAYVHLLVREGMEEGELAEAREDLDLLEKEYVYIFRPFREDEEDSD